MATHTKKTTIAIIGGGITGLTLAARLEKAGVDYLLIDGQTTLGGSLRGQDERGVWLDYGIKSVPVGEDVSQNPLLQLKRELDLKFQIESWTETAKTFEKDSFIDFVGFGETKERHLIDELGYYTMAPRLMVSGGWNALVEELLSIIPEKRRWTQSIVTKLDTQDDIVTAAHINGDTILTADKFVFAMSPASLRELLPLGSISGKLLQRMARTTPLTAISLDIATTKQATPDKNIFVFKDTPKNEEPFFVVGYFVSNIDPVRKTSGLHISTWLTLVDPELLLEDENGSKVIKHMKKLIKKAFPTLIDDQLQEKSWERLLVVPRALGQFEQLTLEKNSTLPGLTNLWVCGGQVQGSHAGARNVITALMSSKNVAESLLGVEESTKVESRKAAPEEAAPL